LFWIVIGARILSLSTANKGPGRRVATLVVRLHRHWAQTRSFLVSKLLWASWLGPWWFCTELRCFDFGFALFLLMTGP
jgi:hypothetical protein